MKKVVKILVPFLVLSSSAMASCKNNKKNKDNLSDKILLSFGDVHANGVKRINVLDVNDHIHAKESFMLAVSSSTCSCWLDFKPVLQSYVDENKLVCYEIPFDNVADFAGTLGLSGLSRSTTSFFIFEDGKVKKSLNSSNDRNIMEDSSSFKRYMEENIIKPGCYFINEDDVKNIKNSGKNAVIYYERSGCGDCSQINPNILRSYVSSNPNMKKIYVLDCQKYYPTIDTKTSQGKSMFDLYLAAHPDYTKTNDEFMEDLLKDDSEISSEVYNLYVTAQTEDEKQAKTSSNWLNDLKDRKQQEVTYQSIKDDFGLSSKNNPDYGFDNGVFPYFSYIENGSYASGAVIYNDSIDENYNISKSYYSEDRIEKLKYTSTIIEGQKLTKTDINEGEYNGITYRSWKYESADQIYKGILKSFLDYALPKTTYVF